MYNQSQKGHAKRIAPHEYFTVRERTVWRNLAAWKFVGNTGWFDYPGPSSWWPEDYDYVKHGWVPDKDSKKAEFAYSLIMDDFGYEEVPKAFKDFKLSRTKLTMK